MTEALGPELSHAFTLASVWHRDQERKGRGTPYLAHPMSVAALVLESGGDEELAIAGLLHDAIEDAPDRPAADRRREVIRREFGARVEEAVAGCTDGDPDEKKRLGWRERKERYITHLRNEAGPDAVAVSLCDKLHNVRSILRDVRRRGDEVWERFTPSRKETLWYYRALAEAYRDRTDALAGALPGYEDPLDELERVLEEITERAAAKRMAALHPTAEPPPGEEPRVVAVDWSGARNGAHRKIWLAEVAGGVLLRLENGRDRNELVRHLVELAGEHARIVIGFDFAFSFPGWFLDAHGVDTGPEAWKLAAEKGEEWLDDCEDPFWGRPGRGKPELPGHFRETEREARSIAGVHPKSVFQIGGAGAVGTGSLRGMPYLAELSEAGFSIWPFEPADWPLVVEIYPRLLTGELVKSDPEAREEHLERSFADLPPRFREKAADSADALDAAVSALVMDRHRDELCSLGSPLAEVARREGTIWYPGGLGRGTSVREPLTLQPAEAS